MFKQHLRIHLYGTRLLINTINLNSLIKLKKLDKKHLQKLIFLTISYKHMKITSSLPQQFQVRE